MQLPSSTTKSHTNLEEVIFWTGLEEALKHTWSILATSSVALTVAVLKLKAQGMKSVCHHHSPNKYLWTYPVDQMVTVRDWMAIRVSPIHDPPELALRPGMMLMTEVATLKKLCERMKSTLRELVV